MITSTDAKEAFDKFHHLFMIKTLSKVGILETYLNAIKAIYDKPIAKKHTQWAKTTSVCLKAGNKTWMSAFTSLIQLSIRSPSHSSHIKRRNKRQPNWKRSKTVIICR